MSIKKTLALIAALTLISTAFVGCDKNKDSSKASTSDSSSKASSSDGGDSSSSGGSSAEIKLPTSGKTFTVMSWNDEFPKMVANYYIPDEGGTVEIKPGEGGDIVDEDGNPVTDEDGNVKKKDLVVASLGDVEYKAQFFGVGGGQASQYYDAYFLSGEDVDLYCVEADFALTYLNSSYAAPLSDVGLTKEDFSKNYDYTLEIGTAEDGTLKGVSFQAAPGGFVYRSDLAEKYLGVKTPDEMQAKVKDWDTFKETAKTVYDASSNETALTSTLGGIWQVFSSARDKAWVTDGTLNISDDVKNFLTFAKEMTDNGYVTKVNQWSDSWYALGQTDQTMGYFVSTWGLKDTGTKNGNGFMTDAAGAVGGATYGKWAICEGPQPYFWGGTWLVVPPSCDNADLAKGVLEYFCKNDESMKKYAEKTGDFVNNKDVMAELVTAGTNKNGNLGGQDQFQVLNKVAEKITMNSSLITEYDASIKASFQTVYGDYVENKYDSVDAAIEAFKKDVATKNTDIKIPS
ncbi:MAG: carbohydrate ABC transporter substrate-binding protein [Clostridiales bacterium]|jgi:multiple sugar transport system substrate-binding protein|nr:carbohydrate ABC transporter substrate-binding protein [Clostridiales bacterium]